MMMNSTNASSYSNYGYYDYESATIKGSTDDDSTEILSSTDKTSLGKDDFLKLLIAQLKNQDPLSPTDNTEFVAQLAQFSSLEQMSQMNTTLEKSLANSDGMTQAVTNAMIVNYFGKEVTVESDTFIYDGEKEAILRIDLESAAANGEIKVTNSDGAILLSRTLGSMDAGENYIAWDGSTTWGTKASAGTYTIEVEFTDVLGNEVTATPLYTGEVTGISYRDGTTNLDLDGLLVPYENVRGISAD